MALPVLHTEAKFGPLEKRIKKMTSIEMKFFRTAGYTLLDHRRNEEILEELKAEPADEKLSRYISNLLRHATRMDSNRMPKIMLNCRPNGRRRLGTSLKRLSDEAGTGLSRPDT